MKNRIDLKFKALAKENKKAFVAYVMAGYPDLRTTKNLVRGLTDAGADIIELGVPFSDPLADGPTIQRAASWAIGKNVNMPEVLRLTREMRREGLDTPIVFMTYYNILYNYGLGKFVKDASLAGVDGAIIPDLPVEESALFRREAARRNFDVIFLAAPTSSRERLRAIAGKSRGFIYYVSVTGITGARKRFPKDIKKHINDLKKLSKKPVCVGFGISSVRQAGKIGRLADGIIVGSAIINRIDSRKKDISKAVKFAGEISAAVRKI
jgi:tryptophan synthase alpha chain